MLPVISDPESLSTVSDSRDSAETTDATFDLLADHHRRAVLRYLDEHETTVSLSDLADHLVVEEEGRDTGPIAATGDALLGTRRRVQISLRHTHVPKLADAGVVDFDPDANVVTLREAGTELLSRLDGTTGERA